MKTGNMGIKLWITRGNDTPALTLPSGRMLQYLILIYTVLHNMITWENKKIINCTLLQIILYVSTAFLHYNINECIFFFFHCLE